MIDDAPPPDAVLVWRPDEFPPPGGPPVPATACCLRSTTHGDRAVVYRSVAERGIAAVFDVLSVAASGDGRGSTAHGVLHPLDPYLERAALLDDPELRPVFAHLQGRRRLPGPVSRRLHALLPKIPFGDRPWPDRALDGTMPSAGPRYVVPVVGAGVVIS